MENKELQQQINETFVEHFGETPFDERIKDIQGEFFELMKWTNLTNLKEETGHLLTSLIQLCNESGWSSEEMIIETLNTIKGRAEQYKTLGRKKNIAILGGAFNPIHLGHIQLAQFVLNAAKIYDEVWLMPAYNHKDGKEMVSPEHRLAMCELAAKVDKRIKVFDYEIQNKLAGETYYFIKKLKTEKQLLEKYRFAMILGIDNANNFDTWVNFEELEKMAKFIVVKRKGVERNYDVDWYLQKPHVFLNCETPIIDVSSTQIREMITNTNFHGIDQYMDENVLKYIKENNIYDGNTNHENSK